VGTEIIFGEEIRSLVPFASLFWTEIFKRMGNPSESASLLVRGCFLGPKICLVHQRAEVFPVEWKGPAF